MKTTLYLETSLNQLFTQTFPYSPPKWFRRIIANWAWLIVPGIIIVQPWTFWGYWDDVHATAAGPNILLYVALATMALEVALQAIAIPGLRHHQKSSWQLLYYSVFCNLIYGIVRIFASEGSVGPLCGVAVLSILFFYGLFQIRPWFKD